MTASPQLEAIVAELNPYLVFKGDCAAAMRFYEQVLGGELDIKTHGESLPPEHVAPGAADLVMHARLEFDGNVLMASDDQVGAPKTPPAGFSLSLTYKTAEESRRIFDALAEGGRVTMAFEKTFWSSGFGMLVDRFGMPWMVNTENSNG
jgi:PhnB protein